MLSKVPLFPLFTISSLFQGMIYRPNNIVCTVLHCADLRVCLHGGVSVKTRTTSAETNIGTDDVYAI